MISTTHRLEQSLKKIGCDPDTLAGLKTSGHILLKRHDSHSMLLTPSQEGDAVFIICHLININASTEVELLAYALQLNLSPAHTFSASIGYDMEQSRLCLRYTHDLSNDTNNALARVLDNIDRLAEELIEAFSEYQQIAGRKSRR